LLQCKYRTFLANVFGSDIASPTDAYPAFHAHLMVLRALGVARKLFRQNPTRKSRLDEYRTPRTIIPAYFFDRLSRSSPFNDSRFGHLSSVLNLAEIVPS
jgi:hypothetical protein